MLHVTSPDVAEDVLASCMGLSHLWLFSTSAMSEYPAVDFLTPTESATARNPEFAGRIIVEETSGIAPATETARPHLAGADLTDAALAGIGELQTVERLDLGSSGITDAGLKHLSGLKNLRELDLGRTASPRRS